jgi:hypothetical protein
LEHNWQEDDCLPPKHSQPESRTRIQGILSASMPNYL